MKKLLSGSRYITLSLLFLFATALLDRGLYVVLSGGLRRVESGQISGGMINKARKEHAEVVILGSSRAVRHYDPRILSAALQKTTFNAGCDGMGLNYCLGLMDLILKDYKPELFIVNVDATSIATIRKQDLDRIKILAPFMHESGLIRKMIYDLGFFEPVKYSLQSFKFNGRVLPIIKNMFEQDESMSGFMPLDKNADTAMLNKLPRISTDKLQPYPYMVQLLRLLINRARSAGARIVLVNAPTWCDAFTIDPDNKRLLDHVADIAREESAAYLSITQENTPAFHDPELFADHAHLNRAGAKIFSEMLAAWLCKNTIPCPP